MSEEKLLTDMVDAFAKRMRRKLQAKRRNRWTGWRMSGFKSKLEDDLLTHLKLALQGDASQWVDVANYAAFLDYQARDNDERF